MEKPELIAQRSKKYQVSFWLSKPRRQRYIEFFFSPSCGPSALAFVNVLTPAFHARFFGADFGCVCHLLPRHAGDIKIYSALASRGAAMPSTVQRVFIATAQNGHALPWDQLEQIVGKNSFGGPDRELAKASAHLMRLAASKLGVRETPTILFDGRTYSDPSVSLLKRLKPAA